MNLKSILLLSAFSIVGAANAGTISATASANATIRPAGPRLSSGAVVTSSFNAEGVTNAANASFAVADFTAASFGAPVTSTLVSAELDLTEFNAAFTVPAALHFYATTVTTPITATSTLTYQTPGDATNAFGIGSQMGSMIDLGTGTFSTTGNVNNGQLDKYTLSFSAAAKGYFTTALATSTGTVRILVASETAGGAATFAGYSSTTYAGPQLVLTTQAVPEPSVLAALGLGAVAILRRRKKA